MERALLDTSTLSEVMRRQNVAVLDRAATYLANHGRFSFSLITRYEILRGLHARAAQRQLALFEERCAVSEVLPLTDSVIVRASELYAELHRRGAFISDADLLIAATALVHDLPLVTENRRHFERLPTLHVHSWRD